MPAKPSKLWDGLNVTDGDVMSDGRCSEVGLAK